MKLTTLLKSQISLSIPYEIIIHDITLDSREVKPGSLFVALTGTHHAGGEYIEKAIAAGAVAVLQEGEKEILHWQEKIPLISIPHLRQHLGELAACFFNEPGKKLEVIGITGTNGKTSCCYFLAQAMKTVGRKPAIIGTLGVGSIDHLAYTGMTTPDVISIHRYFSEFIKEGIDTVIMEVSSHALDQERVNGIIFEAAVFTNLTQDHLDYHHTMEAYATAKRRLLQWPGLKKFVVNTDDEEGCYWLENLAERGLKTCAYSQHAIAANGLFVCARKSTCSMQGVSMDIESSWGKATLALQLLGQFNVSNVLAVLGCLQLLNYPLQESIKALQQLHPVPGRIEVIRLPNKPVAVVDFAHTPDALHQILATIKAVCEGKLMVVFGCGGDRDRGKRPLMAQAVAQYADEIIVTSDNPRTEDPKQIFTDILAGFDSLQVVKVIEDRRAAIEYAMSHATQRDCVLIAGKGHETYQIIGQEKIYFSDQETVIMCGKFVRA